MELSGALGSNSKNFWASASIPAAAKKIAFPAHSAGSQSNSGQNPPSFRRACEIFFNMLPFCAGAGAIAKPKFRVPRAFPDSPACGFFSAVPHFQIGKFYRVLPFEDFALANGRRPARNFFLIT